MTRPGRAGALLMTYGSPDSLSREDVGAYLARVRGGRTPDPGLVDEFMRRYRVIGGSPLIATTREQAAALEGRLGWPVEAGMRFSEPSIEHALRALSDRGVEEVAAVVLSPQFSPQLMGGYGRALDEARARLGDAVPRVVVAGSWHEEPGFVAALASRVLEGRAALERDAGGAVRVLLTAHSVPKRIADSEPDYIAQLRGTAEAVAAQAGLTSDEWMFCWQSAGHEPGEWMRPDLTDALAGAATSGMPAVVVAPVQFLGDHLETLYDIDVAARAQADAVGVRFARIPALGSDAGLIAALANAARLALESIGQADDALVPASSVPSLRG